MSRTQYSVGHRLGPDAPAHFPALRRWDSLTDKQPRRQKDNHKWVDTDRPTETKQSDTNTPTLTHTYTHTGSKMDR